MLRDLIALPSVNPAFTTPEDPAAGECRVADYLMSAAARVGLDVDFQEVLPGRRNVLIRLAAPSARRPARRILLAPHMDTVTLHSPTQLDPVVRKGRIHGRGACDTKGSVAAMFTAMARLAQSPTRPRRTEILLAALIDEENGQTGSRALVRSGLKASFAIVGEPTLLQVVTAHKGDLWLEMTTRGLAAHSSQPALGVNAIAKMARVVSLLEGPYSRSLRRRKHPLLGTATVNVGMIKGGVQPNIVPSLCEIRVDRRTLPGETDAGVRREIRDFLRRHACDVEMRDWKGAPSCALETDTELPEVRRLMALGGQTKPAGANYFSDAGVLAGGGIPSVVMGPGDIAQAHTSDEWISVRQLESGTDLLHRFLGGLE